MRHKAARFFGAFKKAIDKLVTYYQQISAIQTTPIEPVSEFPYKCDYKSLDNGKTICFKYKEQLTTDKLLFLAETEDNGKKLIKFTKSYSAEVHLACGTAAWW